MSSLHRKSLIATAAIFCCRFTGLLREVVYTALFGATGALDAFLTAFRVPNMLRDMFAEGALSQSFTSVVSKVERQEGTAAAWTLAHRVGSQLVSLMLCLVSVGILLAGSFMQQLYPERAKVVLTAPTEAPSASGMDVAAGTLPAEEAPAAPGIVATVGRTTEAGTSATAETTGEPGVSGAAVTATFLGLRSDADGLREACFSAPSGLSGLTSLSCVRVSGLEKKHPGEPVLLYMGEKPTASPSVAALRVEPRSYLGLATDLCRIMWPFILLASLSALSMGVLNMFGIFGLPNLASAAFNLTTIALGIGIGWFLDPTFGPRALYGFAIAVVFGGMAQLLVQLPRLRQKGYRFHWDIGLCLKNGRPAFTDEKVRRVWVLMVPGVIAAGITQTNIFINTSFALYLPGGSVTALSSAFHLWQLPVALFGVAVGMVVLPAVSRMTLVEGKGAIAGHLAQAMRFVAFFAVPSAVVLGLWGEEIVSIFFQRGRFDAAASALTGQVLAAYSFGLLGYAGMKVLQPVFLALEKPWAPAGLALAACAISISLNYTFVHVLHLGASYLALTTSVVTLLNFFFYFFYLRHLLGSMACHLLVPGVLRIVASGIVLGILCWQVRELFFEGFTVWGFWARLSGMAVAGAVAGGIYLAACFFFRVPELEAFATRFLLRRRS